MPEPVENTLLISASRDAQNTSDLLSSSLSGLHSVNGPMPAPWLHARLRQDATRAAE